MAYREGEGLHPLLRLIIALPPVGLCLARLFREWDRRVEKAFGPNPPAGTPTRGSGRGVGPLSSSRIDQPPAAPVTGMTCRHTRPPRLAAGTMAAMPHRPKVIVA